MTTRKENDNSGIPTLAVCSTRRQLSSVCKTLLLLNPLKYADIFSKEVRTCQARSAPAATVISASIPLPLFLMVIELPLFDFNFSPNNQIRWSL
jgi:hypothetical protein